MTEDQKKTVRKVFKDTYWDLRIYRWMVKKKKAFLLTMGVAFGIGLTCLVFGDHVPITVAFFVAFPLVVLGGIDHQIIGARLKRMIDILKTYHNIEVGREELVEACRDLLK